MLLPLPKAVYPYLALLRQLTPRGEGPVFPASRRAASTSLSMSPGVFTSFVKATFSKYTEGGKGPNPSLLRSIFTTWLYGLQYDTEDAFLQEIKASSAKWKAHSEQMAATVYNKDLIYQHKAFAQLLLFCERYSQRYAYDRQASADQPRVQAERSMTAAGSHLRGERRDRARSPLQESEAESSSHGQSSRKRSREKASHNTNTGQDGGADEYVVEALLDVRVNKHGEKQVQVKWEGYHRTTWEPYQSMQKQLPDMLLRLENEVAKADGKEVRDDEDSTVHAFLRRVHRCTQSGSGLSVAARSTEHIGAGGRRLLSTCQANGDRAEEEDDAVGEWHRVISASTLLRIGVEVFGQLSLV